MPLEPVICPYCDQRASWVSNEIVYGRAIGKSYMIWHCRPCDSYVGCHSNTMKAKGTLANAELRALRVRCHAHIDPLWKGGRYRRSTVYQALSHVFGREIHIGSTDVETCEKILALKFMIKEKV